MIKICKIAYLLIILVVLSSLITLQDMNEQQNGSNNSKSLTSSNNYQLKRNSDVKLVPFKNTLFNSTHPVPDARLSKSTFQVHDLDQKVSMLDSSSDSMTGFISQWNTTQISSGSSAGNQIKLPLESDGTYNFNVSWGDGNSNVITAYNQSDVLHTYSHGGIYMITITGTLIGWRFNNSGDVQKIIQIEKWGPVKLGNDGNYFDGASN